MEKNNNIIKQACSEALKNIPFKQKQVIVRRFGLAGKEKETLESIGKDFNITRERVRQIEKDAFCQIKKNIKNNKKIFNLFNNEIKKTGGLRKEESFLTALASQELRNETYFLLTLTDSLERIKETKDYYSLWVLDQKVFKQAQAVIKTNYQKLKKQGKPLRIKDLDKPASLKPEAFYCFLEISKKILNNKEGFWGLREWPEINPRTIKDKAYLVLKKIQQPLHFNKVTSLIDSALPQTVHNELIKDSRFVLIGRGTYALREWGYQEGVVKDVLLNILKESEKPLKKEEVLAKVLKQRMVKENTVFLNLSNRKIFSRTPEGYYKIREA
jgi:hypothetical protein